MELPRRPDRLLLRSEVTEKLRIHKTTLYRLERSGNFPPPIELGRKLAWRESEIDAWVVSRRRQRVAD